MKLIGIVIVGMSLGALIYGIWGAIIGGAIGSIIVEIEYYDRGK